MSDDLIARAEQLKAFIRQHASGGCRMLSLGNDCSCHLCAVDNLLTRLQAQASPCVCTIDDGLVREWVQKARAVAKSKGYDLASAPSGSPAWCSIAPSACVYPVCQCKPAEAGVMT